MLEGRRALWPRTHAGSPSMTSRYRRRSRGASSRALLFSLLSLTSPILLGACSLEDLEPGPGSGGGGGTTAAGSGSSSGTAPLGGDSGNSGGSGNDGEPGGAMSSPSGGTQASGGKGGSSGSSNPPVDAAGNGGAEQGGGEGMSESDQGGSAGAGGEASIPDPYSGPFKVLVLEKTLDFRHDSIPLCESLLTELGKTADTAMPAGTKPSSQFTVTIANDNLSEFTDAGLASYALVFSCNSTGEVFSDSPNGAVGMAALQKFVEGGGAWAGVHAALDFEKTGGFPWFTNTLTGAYMVSHDMPGTIWNVTVPGAFANHPVVSGVPNPWSAADEWYNLSQTIEALPGFTIVQKLPDNRPVTWIKNVSKGRMFYTVRGHAKAVYAEAEFKRLLLNGVLWATRRLN